MKFLKLFLLLNLLSIVVSGQDFDTTLVELDTSKFRTTNAFLIQQKNYETFNNSFITGNSSAIIRSQDNPKILIDGIPINPILINNTHYTEFLGQMHLLSYDIQGVSVHTLKNDNKIVSGNYNNAISFNTNEIKLGNNLPQFEVNNFTTLAYLDFDSTGFSTIFNFKAQKSFEKFGYRLSLNNGFQNDYIPENGLQRYGGNLKLKFKPTKRMLFTGFLDYTNFQDFKRTGDNNLKSNRLLTYINTDITITEWLLLYGRYSLNKVSDISERDLNYVGEYWNGEQYSESYFEKINYKYASSFFDIGFCFNKKVVRNTRINLKLGYSLNNINYFNENETDYRHSNGNYGKSKYKSEPEETEKALYSSFELRNKYVTLKYLLNKTDYGFNNLSSLKENENKSFTNQLVSLNFDILKNNDRIINDLGFGATYGKLTNYSIITQPIYINPLPGYQEPEWITAYNNDNIEFDLFSSFLKNRIDVNFSLYYKNYNEYNHLFEFVTWNGFYSSLEDIGNVTKNGYELNGNFNIIQNKSLNWLMSFSFSENSTELERNEELMFQIADTIIKNKVISITNNFRYKNFQLQIVFEGKNGYDLTLYNNNITVSEPFSYWERTQISEINNEGVPTSTRIENYENYITDTDYFILKQIGIEYQTKNNTKGNYYVIGLQYNKMRRLYQYVNDIEKYQEQFQKPSFYNAVSLSFKMKF
jgi:hypothetical protein